MSLYTWTIGVSDHATTGFAASYEAAVDKIRELVELYKAGRVDVKHYSVEDPSGAVLLSMDNHRRD